MFAHLLEGRDEESQAEFLEQLRGPVADVDERRARFARRRQLAIVHGGEVG